MVVVGRSRRRGTPGYRVTEQAINSHDCDVRWIATDDVVAVCWYRFTWSGLVDGQPRSGGGRGTNVLTRRDGSWQMVHEHLSH